MNLMDSAVLRMLDLLDAQGMPKPDETRRDESGRLTFLWNEAKVAVVLDFAPFMAAEQALALAATQTIERGQSLPFSICPLCDNESERDHDEACFACKPDDLAEARERWDRDYPDSPIPPAWFDPTAAGECWDEEY